MKLLGLLNFLLELQMFYIRHLTRHFVILDNLLAQECPQKTRHFRIGITYAFL